MDDTVGHLGGRPHLAVVEVVAAELHDLVIHAVLNLEQRDTLGFVVDDALHEGRAQATLQGLETLDGGRQLAVVPGKYHTAGTADGNPAGRLERLGRLVDEQGAELVTVEQLVARPDEGRSDDTCLPENVGVDAHLEFYSHLLEALNLLVETLATLAATASHLAHSAPHLPQLGIVRMVGKAVLIGETQHLVVDAGGIAQPQHRDTAVHQFLADPVQGGIALGTHQHLGLALEGLVDGLDQRRRLARARRTVQHTHVLGPQHIVDGTFLARVEPREPHRVKGERPCRLVAVEQVAQVGQPRTLGIHDALQGVEHEAVTCLVKEQLHTQRQRRVLQFERVSLGDGHDHTVAVDVGNGAREAEKADSRRLFQVALGCLGAEEDHRLAVLEVVVDFLVALPGHLDAVLVDRVVVGAARMQRKPSVTAGDLAGQPDALGQQPISLLLLLVFLAEQFTLHLQLRYGRRITHRRDFPATKVQLILGT